MPNFIDDQEIEKLSSGERAILRQILEEWSNKGQSVSYGHLLNEIYSEIPVDPLEFIDSPKYLNIKSQIYNRIKYIFCEADDPDINCVYLCMGKGSGKSSISALLAARSVYRLCCLKDPQAYFGLMPSSEIVILNLSTNEAQAKNVVFKAIKGVIEKAPCFKGKFSPPLGQELRFPDKYITAYSGHSGSSSWLGFSVICGILDEADYFLDRNEQSVAQKLTSALKGSLETRWEHGWKLCTISSPESSTGFLVSTIDNLKEGAVYLDPHKWPK